jgi:DNA polymerase-3 subunit gamma/tau
MEVPDAALGLIARSGRGSFRDAESTLDQLAAATAGQVTVQDVQQLLGAVDEEVLFRHCDLVVDRDTAGALVFLEELSERGQDLGRLVIDLLEHLRHLLLVQHTGDVPETLPVTGETRERLREQANQLGASTVVRLIDLLTPAVEDMRQGGDPRLPLELALVKVTRPGSDLSREGLALRLQRLEEGQPAPPEKPVSPPGPAVERPKQEAKEDAPDLALEQLQEAWRRSVLPAVEERSIPAGAMLAEARPAKLEGDTLTLEFPPKAGFHREQAEEPKNAGLLGDALYEVTGRRLSLVFAEGAEQEAKTEKQDQPATEEEIVELVKSTFDAREVDD